MAFIRRKIVGNNAYYEVVESVYERGKTLQKVLKYLGSLDAANAYGRRHGLGQIQEKGLLDPGIAWLLERKLKALNSQRPLSQATLRSLREKLSVELTYNSNAIEGNTLTLKETRLVVLDGITVGGHPLREIFEARNHMDAIDLVYRMAEAGKGIREKDVLDLHAAITRGTLPENECGFYRTGNVLITGSKHRPPDWREAHGMMQEKVYPELNSKAMGTAAVESAAEVHFWTASIHPFSDGNGRLARLLMNIRLMRAGFPPAVVLMRDRAVYYEALRRADEGNLKPLAGFVAKTVLKALDMWLSVAK